MSDSCLPSKRLDEGEKNRKKIILAVDDSPVLLKSVSAALSDVYKVYMLSDPAELEKVLRKLTPDLFLLDYQMPLINGFDLIPIIRSFEKHKDTPIIFLTSMRKLEILTAAISFGACDCIIKPFKPAILRNKIEKHIIMDWS